jgi:hypothetical protein
MADTLDKIKRLERYIAADKATDDPVLDLALEKMLARETAQVQDLKSRLASQIVAFEKTHGMDSEVFYAKFQNGELGDDADFIEWASTIEMVGRAEKRMAALRDS